mmetsp:Transcript_3121/g.10324  ORF Transcript_3121/g.10324 Transcript_3121/m.10324 type:complete len:152 (-) Transcript_3121:606-1061(-)
MTNIIQAYREALGMYVCRRLSKSELDTVVLRALGSENIRKHNTLLLALLSDVRRFLIVIDLCERRRPGAPCASARGAGSGRRGRRCSRKSPRKTAPTTPKTPPTTSRRSGGAGGTPSWRRRRRFPTTTTKAAGATRSSSATPASTARASSP